MLIVVKMLINLLIVCQYLVYENFLIDFSECSSQLFLRFQRLEMFVKTVLLIGVVGDRQSRKNILNRYFKIHIGSRGLYGPYKLCTGFQGTFLCQGNFCSFTGLYGSLYVKDLLQVYSVSSSVVFVLRGVLVE